MINAYFNESNLSEQFEQFITQARASSETARTTKRKFFKVRYSSDDPIAFAQIELMNQRISTTELLQKNT